MWIRIRAVIIEDEPLAAQYLAALLDDTCQVEVVDTAADSEDCAFAPSYGRMSSFWISICRVETVFH